MDCLLHLFLMWRMRNIAELLPINVSAKIDHSNIFRGEENCEIHHKI